MINIPILAFDIETIPDAHAIRILNQLPNNLSDAETVEFAQQQRRAKTGNDFMPLHLQKVIAISCCLRWDDKIHISSLGNIHSNEAEIIQKFFHLLDKFTPQLISWNGGGFDLPVLHYRALIHGIQANNYWDMGEKNSSFKYNNYISRYHNRHTDLMDLLSLYNLRAAVPLDDLAKLCGFAGKLGMDGSQVWQNYINGNLEAIRHYCETDATNTYLIFQRFRLMNGTLTLNNYQQEIEKLQQYLQTIGKNKPHWQEFLNTWQQSTYLTQG